MEPHASRLGQLSPYFTVPTSNSINKRYLFSEKKKSFCPPSTEILKCTLLKILVEILNKTLVVVTFAVFWGMTGL